MIILLGVKELAARVRQHKNKIDLIQRVLEAKPENYTHVKKILHLAKLLKAQPPAIEGRKTASNELGSLS